MVNDLGVLADVRVLDLSIWRPGPYATQLLAELGADVLKVEPPGGDPMRVFPELFEMINAHKRSVVLDLKDPAGQARALELAAEADVLIEGFRPGVVERLGVDYEQVRAVNPSIVYCSVSGYGQTGPLVAVPGHDVNYQATAGVLAPTPGSPPVVGTLPVADLAAGMAAAMAVCAAVIGARRNGEGEYIDVAMADVLATWVGPFDGTQLAGSDEPMRGSVGYGTFICADGQYVSLGVIAEDHFWRRLCLTLGLDDVADVGVVERNRRREELQTRVTDAVGTWDRAALVDALQAANVPVAPVLTRAEMLALDHFAIRDVVRRSPDGRVTMGHPARLVSHPTRSPGRAPKLDEHRGQSFPSRDEPRTEERVG
jgi:crotonobetainyl-CoA:carnitine CoA-transferase CaiB-like acyl-CoA transferase